MYLSDFALKTWIQPTVTVRLDYCNSLYYGLTQKSTRKLQLAQNAAARLIATISIRDPMTNVLRELYWLPVSKRCQYKLLVLTYFRWEDAKRAYLKFIDNEIITRHITRNPCTLRYTYSYTLIYTKTHRIYTKLQIVT